MATLLLPESPTPMRPAHGQATLAVLCSPIRGADGAWRVFRRVIEAEQSLAEALPPGLQVAKLIVNGGVVACEDAAAYALQDGDEVLVIPQWGYEAVAAVIAYVGWQTIAAVAISAALSIGLTYLSYVLFPPPKAHNIQQRPDEPTFSFEGIRTAIGPGMVVPVIYGRQRVGGQLLSSSVDQGLTVLDNGTAVRRVQAISTPATITMLLGLGEGPVHSVDTASVEINGQPVANFPGVEVYTSGGFDPQAPLIYFGETRNTFSDGRDIAETSSSITYTTTVPVEAFVLNIAFNRGLFAFTPKGEKVDNPVILQYRYRAVGGDWWGWSPFEVVANRTSVVRFGIRKEGLALAQYDIELQVISVGTTIQAEWQPSLESVTEIQSNTQTYPSTALLGLRALATDALQGALPNVTVDVYGRTVRMGNFAGPEAWTDNPAWCVMDFLTSTRYGLGIPDAEIDLGAFTAWASYCEEIVDGERRHTLNYALDRDTRAQQALLEMMGGSRTILFKTEGLWTPRPTRNDPPVQLLSWANCTDLKLNYVRDQERVNVIEARFANEEQGFEQDVLTWPTIDNWPADMRKTSLEVRGVTKPSRVMRAMQFELNRRAFENMTLEMTCALDAIVLQPHDLFRFSHPLPGWGVSGRIQQGSNTSFLYLDNEVTFNGLHSYIVYVRHEDGTTEVKPVSYPGDVLQRTLTLLAPLSQVPQPRTSLWAFGYLVGPADTAVRTFRVVRMQRMSDTTVRLQAVIHNPSLYDDGEAVPLPVITSLFNPLGPPPGLTSLVLTEATRIQASGASLRVVHVSWDVAGLGPGYAPYGGALILRRTVQESALGGSGSLGGTQAASLQDSTDGTSNFAPITQVHGHVLDFDDYTIATGITYVYRVVPMSNRGVPNNPGALEQIIHVAGPTTPQYFPGIPQNLRLKGQPLGATIFDGPDVHLQWEPVADTSLFTDTFFVADYILEVWAPGQTYRMRHVIVAARGVGVTLDFTYTLQMNTEDQLAAGQQGARRDLLILVWARTNTGRISVSPASLTVVNPPPDMGDMIPTVTTIFGGALITFDQFVEPRDFSYYQIYLDTITPPVAIYNDVSVSFHGPGRAIRQVQVNGLTVGVTYYVYVLPYDTFGPGIPTHITSFIPTGMNADDLDQIPPGTPTGLVLTTGTTVNPDGTIMNWVQASWNLNTEADMSTYEVHFRVDPNSSVTPFLVSHPTTFVRLENVPGHVTVHARLLAYDKFHNISAFTDEISIVTQGDTIPPAAPTNLTAIGSIRSVALLWTPPADLDYSHALVYANRTNFFGSASIVGSGYFDFIHEGLLANDTWYYWLRSVDTSGNLSTATHPASFTAGVQGIAGQLDTTYISSLAVSKLTAGLVNVLWQLGVAAKVFLDGPNNQIYIYDDQAPPQLRVRLGKFGAFSEDYGVQVYNEDGALMFSASTGVTAAGITAGVINAGHLRTDQAVITGTAQIGTAVITTVHVDSIAVNKIINGLMANFWQIGVGNNLFLDGNNANIYVYDQQSTPQLRGMFGKLGTGANDYGLQIWNPAGQLMWDFNGGATSNGLNNNAVTTPKIIANAVTQSVTLVAPGQVTTGSSLGSGGAVAVGACLAGDRLWLLFKALGQNIGNTAAQLEATLSDFEGATTLDVTYLKDAGMGSIVLQYVWTAPADIAGRTFTCQFRNIAGTDLVGMSNRSFVVTRLQR